MRFFTIGVYNSTEREFFRKLIDNNIDTFCDIRQRRGVRGSKYAFVNSKRLQTKLLETGINYLYEPDLSPTPDIRELQKKVDALNHETKSERKVLGDTFRLEYQNRILNKFDFASFFEKLKSRNASGVVLFCVEEFPEACHRSLVSRKLEGDYQFTITNL